MPRRPAHISVMLAVTDARAAVDWYARALGATELWDLGSGIGLEIPSVTSGSLATGRR